MADGTMEHNSARQVKIVDEDERLISAAKKDLEAFGKLYDKYYKNVFRYIYRRTSDLALTEDLTSNTFLSAFRHIRRYKWRRIPFNAWLHRIAINEVRRHRQKQKRVSAINPQASPLPVGESLAAIEEGIDLHRAIQKLEPIHQTVIMLRFFHGMTIPEISESMGEKEGTVKSRLHRGIEQLRKILTRQGIYTMTEKEEEKNG